MDINAFKTLKMKTTTLPLFVPLAGLDEELARTYTYIRTEDVCAIRLMAPYDITEGAGAEREDPDELVPTSLIRFIELVKEDTTSIMLGQKSPEQYDNPPLCIRVSYISDGYDDFGSKQPKSGKRLIEGQEQYGYDMVPYLQLLGVKELDINAVIDYAVAVDKLVYGVGAEADVESRAQAAADNDEEGQRIMQEEATQDVLDEEAAREMETPGEDDPLDAESLEAFNQAMEKDD